MAAKRISQSAVNWAALAERVPEHQKQLFAAFKTKSDGYLRRVQGLPEAPPKIDWAFYKSKVPVAGMVAEFEKQYSALSIPYPPDTVSSQIDAQADSIKSDIEKFKISVMHILKKQWIHLTNQRSGLIILKNNWVMYLMNLRQRSINL
ncbi:ATP synthase D chain, mitochondrial (ATP5H) [Popillia japonica]|uniref:ATP synthase D chain, mitochondrial (ATP5H) n=1 Tax=Popillia japonica TaxID=7064 RepID=A0AAW1I8Y1_POPJA